MLNLDLSCGWELARRGSRCLFWLVGAASAAPTSGWAAGFHDPGGVFLDSQGRVDTGQGAARQVKAVSAKPVHGW